MVKNKILASGISKSDGLNTRFQLVQNSKIFSVNMREGRTWVEVFHKDHKVSAEKFFQVAIS